MSEYIVEAKSRKALRMLADELKRVLGIENMIRIPIVGVLEILPELFKNCNYEIVPDDSLPDEFHAETDIYSGNITIKESVYEGAIKENGRDRMTIAHEIGHFVTLCFCGFKLQRSFGNKADIYQDPEWQAKCFAGELMVPHHLTLNMSPKEISEKCGVSLYAAKYQYSHRS